MMLSIKNLSLVLCFTLINISPVNADNPQIVWIGQSSIKINARQLHLDGFKIGGSYIDKTAVVSNLQTPFPEVTYNSTNTPGFDVVGNQSTPPKSHWVAVFAVDNDGDGPNLTTIKYVPFTKVTSIYDGGSYTGIYYDSTGISGGVGSTPHTYVYGREILVITEGKKFSNEIYTINGAWTDARIAINTQINNLDLIPGDFLLMAPCSKYYEPNCRFKYLHSLIADGDGSNSIQWRNFTITGNHHYGYIGAPFAPITNTTASTSNILDFHDWVSPLATGVIGNIEVTGNGHVSFDHDNSNHVIASSSGSSNVQLPFNREKQILYPFISGGSAKFVIRGWIE